MIKIIENSLSDNDIKYLFNLWISSKDLIIKNNRNYAKLDILPLMPYLDTLNLNYMHHPKEDYTQLQLQCQDETWGKNEYENSFHTHESYANTVYVQYLNDNFDGGNLIFETGETYKPKKGDTVIFSGNLGHYVQTPRNFTNEYINTNSKDKIYLNKRWVVAGFIQPVNDRVLNDKPLI